MAEDFATAPADVEEGTGVALHNGYPVNLRLRAERMSADGLTEDPDGLVTPELIADAGDRLAREKATEEAEARAAPSMRWTLDELRAEADRLAAAGRIPAVETDANKATILAAIEAAPKEA